MPTLWTGLGFPYAHDWSVPITERLEWATDVIPVRDGDEQRRKLRREPRRFYDYSILLYNSRMRRRFDALLQQAQKQRILIPIWTDAVRLSAATAVGANSFLTQYTAQYHDYVDAYTGGATPIYPQVWAVLFQDEENYEVLGLANSSASGVTTSDPATRAWPAGTVVFPARPAWIQSVQGERVTDTVRRMNVTFMLEPTVDVTQRVLASVPLQYRALDVLQTKTEESSDLAYEILRKLSILDAGVGTIYVDGVAVPAPNHLRAHRQILKTRTEIAAYLGWLYRRAGQLTPLWLPTWEQDFELMGNLVNGASTVLVRQMDYTTRYASHSSRRDIVFVAHNGTFLMRRIVSSIDNLNGTETLTLDAAFTVTQTPADFSHVSFLLPARLDHNQIELTWETNDKVRTEARYRSLTYAPV